MNPDQDRARRINDLFEEVMERETEARESRLDELSTRTREEVRELLTAHASMGDFLAESAAERIAPEPLAPGTRVGSYMIIRVLGAGGGGTVYEAEQLSPQRRVALKVRQGGLGSSASLRRFREEAEILARLQHPDLAHVYEAGVHDGVPFFALEYVANARHLVEYCRALDRDARLSLFARVCDAIHHGHQKGIVHRDLKPSNILVLPDGHPKIIDFGIARVEGIGATKGELVGTPPYMSPEQCVAGNEDIDVRSDVYSLGVVLFQLLSGALPHDVAGLTITEATRRIREEPPAALPAKLPRDLRAIVGKALRRDREERYASASALGADVRRFLAHEPVAAREAGRLHEVRLFTRRNPAIVAALAIVILVLVGATIVSWSFADRAAEARDRERMQAYAANINAANAALGTYNTAEARRLLREAAPELRDWEWQYLVSQLDKSEMTLDDPRWLTFHAAPRPDGRMIVELGHEKPMDGDGIVALWDVETGELKRHTTFRGASCSPPVFGDGWMAWGIHDAVLVADPETLEVLHRLEGHDEAGVYAVAVRGDGKELISADHLGGIRIWDTRTWTLLREFGKERTGYVSIAYSPDGSRVAVSEHTRNVEIWDPERGEQVLTLEGHEARVERLWFTADGRLVTASTDATLRYWDVESGRQLAVLRGPADAIFAASANDDGTRALTVHEGGTIRLWDLSSGKVLTTLWGHESGEATVRFLKNGRAMSAAKANGIKIWSLETTRTTLGDYPRRVSSVAYSPDGRWLASGSADKSVRLYRLGAENEERILKGHEGGVARVRFSPDSRRIVSIDHQTLRVWDVASGDCVWSREAETEFKCVAFGTRWIAVGEVGWRIVLRDAETGEEVRRIDDQPTTGDLHFLSDGNILLQVVEPAGIRLWDVATGERRREMSFPEGGPCGTIPSRDGQTVAVASHSPWDAAWRALPATIYLVDVPTWTPRLAIPSRGAFCLALSPDGARLAVGATRSVRLFDTRTGRPVIELKEPTWVLAVAFSPDGTQIATGSGSYSNHGCELRLWGRVPGVAWPPEPP